MNTTGYVNIAGSLHSIADDGIVAYAGDIYDPNLKMTLSEINSFDGGIHDDYGWKVVTLEEYDNMVHKDKVLYFIADESTLETSYYENNTIFMSTTYSNYNINVNGTLSNNNLTII